MIGDSLPNESRFLASLHARGIDNLVHARKGKMTVYRGLASDELLAIEIAGDIKAPKGVSILAAMPADATDTARSNVRVIVELLLLLHLMPKPGEWLARQLVALRGMAATRDATVRLNAATYRIKLTWQPQTSLLTFTLHFKGGANAYTDAATA